MKQLLIILALLMAWGQAQAATYYVSTTGSDSASGSSGAPWATIQHASTVVSPGDTVIVENGNYSGDIAIGSSGTSGNYITYIAQNKWQAKLVGTGTGDGSVVVGMTGGYNRFENFDITGTDANGIILATGSTIGAAASFNQAIGNYVHDFSNIPCDSNSGSGVNTGGGSDYLSVTNDDIIGNLVVNIGSTITCPTGPYPTGVYIAIPNSVAENNIIINSGYGFQTWHNANHNIIFGNTVLNNPQGGFIIGEGDVPVGHTWTQTGTLVQNNISTNNSKGFIEEGNTLANSYIDNLIYNNGSCDPSDCTTSPTVVSGTVSANPLFVNNTGTAVGNYSLAATSPAIGTGLFLSSVTKDFLRNPYPTSGATDIGAIVSLVNPSMSKSTIQGIINTACNSGSGNIVTLAAGNYPGALLPWTQPGGHACILAGPVVTPAVDLTNGGNHVTPTVILNSDGALVGGFDIDVTGCTTGAAGSSATLEYLGFGGSNSTPGTGGITADDGCNSVKVFSNSLTGNSPNFGSVNYSGASSIYLPSDSSHFTRNWDIEWNNFSNNCGKIINVHGDNSGYCSATWSDGFISDTTFSNNTINGQEEGFKINVSSGSTAANMTASDNYLYSIHRIGMEWQIGQTTTINNVVNGNYFGPASDPDTLTFGFSLFVCCGDSAPGMTADYNALVQPVQSNVSGYGNAFEIGGNQMTSQGNLIESSPISSQGFVYSVVSSTNANVTGNTISGYYANSLGFCCTLDTSVGPVTTPTLSPNTILLNPPTLVIPTPTISPPGGIVPQTVTLSDSQPNTTIYYTLDGSTPTVNSTPYTGPFVISAAATLKAMAQWGTGANIGIVFPSGWGYTPSAVQSAPFTAGSAPTLTGVSVAGTGGATSVNQGSTLQMVATCSYTGSFTGTTICTTSDAYGNVCGTWTTSNSGVETVSSGGLVSGVSPGTANIGCTVGGHTSSPVAITVNSFLGFIESSKATGSTVVSGGISTGSLTVPTGNNVVVVSVLQFKTSMSGSYTPTIPTVKDQAGNTYIATTSSPQASSVDWNGVSLFYYIDAPAGATTITANNFDASSTGYLVQAIAFSAVGGSVLFDKDAGYVTPSTAATPITLPAIVPAITNELVYGTADPGTGLNAIGTPWTLGNSEPSLGELDGYILSATTSATPLNLMTYSSPDSWVGMEAAFKVTLPTAATPVFTPTSTTFSGSISVSISDTTPASTIYYTTDGSTPTTSSSVYSSALSITSTTTVKAIAAASGYNNSAVGSGIYTMVSGITLTLNPGTIIKANPHQEGLNIGTPSFYDQGQYQKNLIFNNPSFEPVIFQQYYVVNGFPTGGGGNIAGNCNTAGTAVTWVSGSVFTGAQGTLNINGINYLISSVNSSTSITLTATAGTQTNVGFNGGTWDTTHVWGSNIYDGVTPNELAVNGSTPAATLTVVESQNAEQGLASDKGQTVTITANTQANGGANTPAEYTFTPAMPHPMAVGDSFIIKQVRNPTPLADLTVGNGTFGIWPTLSGSGSLSVDSSTCGTICGVQSLRLNATSGSAGVIQYFDSGGTNNFVLVNGAATLSIYYKVISGSPVLTMQAGRVGGSTWCTGTPALTADGAWHQASLSCTGNDTTSTPLAYGNASFSETGGVLDIDNEFFGLNNETNPTIYRNAVVNTWKNDWFNGTTTGPTGTLRGWIGQNGDTLDNLIIPSSYKMDSQAGENGFQGGMVPISYWDELAIDEYLGTDAYLEVPVTFTTTDAENLINWLGGTTGTYAAKRIAQGHTLPYTSTIKKIHLGFCNECWNGGSFIGQGIPYRGSTPGVDYYFDYSLRARDIFAAMRSDPDYAGVASSLDLVYNIQTGIVYDVATSFPVVKPDSAELNGYDQFQISNYTSNGTSCNTTGTLGLWCAALEDPFGYTHDTAPYLGLEPSYATISGLSVCGAAGTAPCGVTVYEQAVSTIAGTIDQTHLDYATRGSARGVVDATMFMEELSLGIETTNYFAANEYTNGGPGGLRSKMWGAYIDYGGDTSALNVGLFGGGYTPAPQALGIAVANQGVIGPLFSCTWTNLPMYNFPGDPNNGSQGSPPGTHALNNVPYLYANCFKDGAGNFAITLSNTSLTSSYTVTFAGTSVPTGAVSVLSYSPTAANPNLLNEGTTASGATNTTPAAVWNVSSSLTSPTSYTIAPLSVVTLKYATSVIGPPVNFKGTSILTGTGVFK